MPIRPYSDALKAIAERKPEFARHLLEDAANSLLNGEIDEGRALLRAHVNASIGFEELGRRTGKSPKSLMRMLGPDGRPTAVNLLDIITHLAQDEGAAFEVQLTRRTVAPVLG
ncbi:transcriptional regulator [Jiella marina]|uniref:transcriptional regulator n=1 Tax=Jiella sp. LLJ827 TaxID=2917712 RepID=UPI0021010ECD|nr:transcriptional regulator [Jiella sp. LLJ827]MCQ0990626.1 transcriptional regulator [Jiella sp. LLJ827]